MIKLLYLSLILTYSTLSLADTGILFVAHGSMKNPQDTGCNKSTSWERGVLTSINSIRAKLPFNSEVVFTMWNTKCFDEGIERLENKLITEGKKLDHLLVYPIFISSFSTVIEMQKYILKLRTDRVIPIPMATKISFTGKVNFLPAIDYNPQVSMILANRAHKLIHLAKERGFSRKQMELVLIMHGPVADRDNEKWVKMGQKYIEDVTYLFPLSKSHLISLRDDAPPEVSNRATEKLQKIVKKASLNNKQALILPLLLSKGGIEKGILKRLEGLDYSWLGEMIFPDKKLANLLLESFKK